MPIVTTALVGDDRLLLMLQSGGVRAVQALGRSIYEEAQYIFAQSQTLVPVKTGTLRSSGQLFPPEVNAEGNVEVRIGYGGAASAYAGIVHERLDVTHDSPTQAKYLEGPMTAAIDGLTARIADRVEAILGGTA